LAAQNRYNRVNKALIAKSDLYAGVVTDLASMPVFQQTFF